MKIETTTTSWPGSACRECAWLVVLTNIHHFCLQLIYLIPPHKDPITTLQKTYIFWYDVHNKNDVPHNSLPSNNILEAAHLGSMEIPTLVVKRTIYRRDEAAKEVIRASHYDVSLLAITYTINDSSTLQATPYEWTPQPVFLMSLLLFHVTQVT